jgi:hypothetical protein
VSIKSFPAYFCLVIVLISLLSNVNAAPLASSLVDGFEVLRPFNSTLTAEGVIETNFLNDDNNPVTVKSVELIDSDDEGLNCTIPTLFPLNVEPKSIFSIETTKCNIYNRIRNYVRFDIKLNFESNGKEEISEGSIFIVYPCNGHCNGLVGEKFEKQWLYFDVFGNVNSIAEAPYAVKLSPDPIYLLSAALVWLILFLAFRKNKRIIKVLKIVLILVIILFLVLLMLIYKQMTTGQG